MSLSGSSSTYWALWELGAWQLPTEEVYHSHSHRQFRTTYHTLTMTEIVYLVWQFFEAPPLLSNWWCVGPQITTTWVRISAWAYLKLNDNKTNILYLASPHCVKSLKMGASSITPNGSVKNLGFIFDQYINMHEHVTSVCRAAYYHLKNIHCLKAFLT